MVTNSNLAAALSGLSTWLLPTTDANSFDVNLLEWVRTCGWRAAGTVWPCDGNATLLKTAQNGSVNVSNLPPELPDVLRRIRQGEPTVTATAANGSLRLYAPLKPNGRPIGLLWAEGPSGTLITDLDRSLVALTARLIENSEAFNAAAGAIIDPDRLLLRLQDAAVIAGRMAHDFDNILTGILGFADLASPHVPAGTIPSKFIGEIGKVGQRGIQFTQQLHSLSRSGQTKPNAGMVAAAILKEEGRLRPAMKPSLRFEKNVPMGLPPVATEAMPLQSIIGHLLENAIEACTEGGLVTISARPVELGETDARAYLGKATVGANLEVTVTDSGPGIKPEVRRRLFAEPFYTTKIRHRGLGLAVVYRTLCVHRGGIRLDPVPSPGTGTVARFVLPLAAARTPVAGPALLGAIPVGG